MSDRLKHAPQVDRFSAPAKAAIDPQKIDRTGGRYGAGIIPGVSLCARGEALGHGMWIDDEFLQQIVDAANTNPKLLKSRFTHPDLCTDGMGKAVGTLENFSKVGDQVYGDLHCYSAAHDAPDGDLAGYVMNLAEEDPTNFGLSIVFSHDYQDEEDFWNENTQEVEGKDDKGNVVSRTKQFQSPDPYNVQNLPHCRLSELRAADVVDEPAANPKGLFHRENALLADGHKLIDYVLGRSSQKPALSSALAADIAPERLKSFVTKYLASAGLSLTKEADMPQSDDKVDPLAAKPADEKKKPDAQPSDAKPDMEPDGDEGTGDPTKQTADDSAADDSANKKTNCDDKSSCSEAKPDASLKEYCDAFGHEDGAKFFLEGVSFKTAQNQLVTSLRAQLKDRDDKLAAFAKLGVEPVGFTPGEDKLRDKSNGETKKTGNEPVDNRAAFAAAIAKPEAK
jgi:hypothetical protein